MRKSIQFIGLLVLMGFSFFYAESTAKVVNSNDDIMISIKDGISRYKVDSMDATIDDKTVIPGVSGKSVDIDASYDDMKKLGKYSPNLLIYKTIKPTISVKYQYDKYIIGGNENKREVALLFKVSNTANITKVRSILSGESVTYFIDDNWASNNSDTIISLIKNNNIIGNMGNNMNYDSNFEWLDTVVTKIGKQDNSFCYVEDYNDDTLDKCYQNKSYTIKPSIVINDNPLINVKRNIKNGSIISFDINKQLEQELPLIIKYIESKDYKIVNLDTLLDE